MISLREISGIDGGTGSDFADEIGAFFAADGALSHTKGFEYRSEQEQMARAVAEALEENRHLIVEAGTGVGKSLAYLIPGILHAVRRGRKALICTHTINLQEQLIFKDIPKLHDLLPVEFEAALLKGRQNYVCPRRLSRALANASGLFQPEQVRELERIREWSLTTKEGSLSDLVVPPDPLVWAEVCSEQHICTPKHCGGNPRCFYQQARKRAASAQVLVLNHTLFFTLLGGMDEVAGHESGYLFANDFAIFDEAHTLEQVASRHIGLGVSQYGLRQCLLRLYNPRNKKGLLKLLGKGEYLPVISELVPELDAFFKKLGDACKFQSGREFRVREPGLVNAGDFSAGLQKAAEIVSMAASQTDDEGNKAELQDTARRLREARAGILSFLEQSEPEHVYWVEQTGKSGAFYSLNAAPVDLAACLRRMLFRENACSILTSATLAVGRNDLSYFRHRMGADGVKALQVGSPFDYKRQMRLHLVKNMPEPRDPGYEDALERWIAYFTELSDARAFVLFTSYKLMQTMADRLADVFAKRRWTLLVQGAGASRTRLVTEFRESGGRCVLFGTDSFWSGVDVPGDALSNVIITRLPFAQPDHPLVEAKLEHLERQGADPFRNYSLPEAILKFRQGVGRLIRTKTDTGIVVVLDSRILKKNYGRAFLASLPECPVEVH